MHKHGLTFIIGCGIVALAILYYALAHAQTMVGPAQVGIGCAYNTAPVALPTGNAGWVSCNQFGSLSITGDGNVPTYSAAALSQASAFAGDLFCLKGSATKVVKLKSIILSAAASGTNNPAISLVRRSTADTDGIALTMVPSDSNSATATASAIGFTSAPTQGTLVGIIRARTMLISNSLTEIPFAYDFASYWDQPQILRGTSESICAVIPSVSGSTWSYSMEWTEN